MRRGPTMKQEITALVNSAEGRCRINHVSELKRLTKDAAGLDCDVLKLEFNTTFFPRCHVYDNTIKSREYAGIIAECEQITRETLQRISDQLCSDIRAGYR